MFHSISSGRWWKNCVGRWNFPFWKWNINRGKWCAKQTPENNNLSGWSGTWSCAWENAAEGSVILFCSFHHCEAVSFGTSLKNNTLFLSFFFQVFNLERVKSQLVPLHIQPSFTVKEMLDRVLRLPAVASKRYLTNKVVNKLEGMKTSSGDNVLSSILFHFAYFSRKYFMSKVITKVTVIQHI